MNKVFEHPLRVELTVLDEKLYRKEFEFIRSPSPHLLFSTRYEDAVSAPFSKDGKKGISVFIGRAEHFEHDKAASLWNLEKERGRIRLAVITNLKGKGFLPAFTSLEDSLKDPLLVPISFLRRRGTEWDYLDFFSSGAASVMNGAAARLKRLKQRGWEILVDRLALTDPEIKALYFETLQVERGHLKQAFLEGLVQGRISAVLGVAGQCLQKEHLQSFLSSGMNARILEAASPQNASRPPSEKWFFLSKSSEATELVMLSYGERWIREGDVLTGELSGSERENEFLVSKVVQRQQIDIGGSIWTCFRLAVHWRYKASCEIPTVWTQKNTSPAGSTLVSG